MPTDNKHIKKQFEKSMKSYDKNAVVQDLTAQKMLDEIIKFSNNFGSILELGSGTGLLTKKIARELRFENFFANDLIAKSNFYVKKFIPDAQFLCGSAVKIKPARKMDLVISNAMFQWFDNLDKALGSIKFLLASGGILAFSTFSPDNFKEIKQLSGLSLAYKTKEEIEKILIENGFDILYSEEFEHILKFNTPLEILAHMKNTGVNSLSTKTWTVKEVKNFCDKYRELYPDNTLTYSPVIFIAKI